MEQGHGYVDVGIGNVSRDGARLLGKARPVGRRGTAGQRAGKLLSNKTGREYPASFVVPGCTVKNKVRIFLSVVSQY